MKIERKEAAVVKFETAKLAKEKGFIDAVGAWKGKNYYNHKGELNGDSTDQLKYYVKLRQNGLSQKGSGDSYNPFDNIAAPTQVVLQDWLREEKGTIVYVFPTVVQFDISTGIRYSWSIIDNKKVEILKEDSSPLGFIEWTDALEDGIKEALNLI